VLGELSGVVEVAELCHIIKNRGRPKKSQKLDQKPGFRNEGIQVNYGQNRKTESAFKPKNEYTS
jgi:hypothetical protein